MSTACNHYFWIDELNKIEHRRQQWEQKYGLQAAAQHDKPVHYHRTVNVPRTAKANAQWEIDRSETPVKQELCVNIRKSGPPSAPRRCKKCKGVVTVFCYECCYCGCKRAKDIEHMRICEEDNRQNESSNKPVRNNSQSSKPSYPTCRPRQKQKKI